MIGQINLTRRQEKSFNGKSVAVLKSAIQKYVRRAMLDKGLWCLVELDLFRSIEADQEAACEYVRRHPRSNSQEKKTDSTDEAVRKARALRTNLLNRLIVMVSEEISVASPWLPLAVDRLAEAWKAGRTEARSGKYLIDLYTLLVEARKIRLISDLKSVYLLPPDYVKPAQRADLRIIHADLLRSLGLANLLEDKEPPATLLDAAAIDLRPFLPARDQERRRIVNGILWNLARASDDVFHGIARLIDRQRDEQGTVKLGGRKDLLEVVWRLLFAFVEKREGLWGGAVETYPESFDRVKEVLIVLRKWYQTMTHREQPVYLYHAVLLIVRRHQIDWNAPVPFVDTPEEEVARRYQANTTGTVVLLDDFVRDIHTGEHDEAGLFRFAREGAHVENENPVFRNESYRLIYQALKERLDDYRKKGLGQIATTSGGTL
jgi:hypothetical protein